MPGTAEAVDLSLGGLALETRSALSTGDHVVVELFDLDDNPVVETRAEVVHVGPGQSGIRAGLRFVSPDKDPVLAMLLRTVLGTPEAVGRRGFPRARLHLPAFSRQGAVKLELIDVAMGGMGFRVVAPDVLPTEVRAGLKITLELVYSPGRTSSIGAEVAWRVRDEEDSPAFGTKFVLLAEGSRQALMRLVDGVELPLEVVVDLQK
jgi:c-di-GMP-binding flagellar brake protein YcgR